jgi:hypothetical protein
MGYLRVFGWVRDELSKESASVSEQLRASLSGAPGWALLVLRFLRLFDSRRIGCAGCLN